MMISNVNCIDANSEQSLHREHHTSKKKSLSVVRDDVQLHKSAVSKQPAVIFVSLLVISLHAGLLILMLTPSSTEQQITLTTPTIAGVLIQMPSTETKKTPKKASYKKSKPAPKPLVRPKHTPVTKKAITLPPVEKKPPIPEIQETTRVNEDNVEVAQKPTPIVVPRIDATRRSNPTPIYPRTSLRRKETGKVILEVLVQVDGSVGEIRIKQSSGFKRLDKSAMKAVKRWRYIPAQQADQAIDYWYQQPIVFSLRK